MVSLYRHIIVEYKDALALLNMPLSLLPDKLESVRDDYLFSAITQSKPQLRCNHRQLIRAR